jgi:hypothetical protein
MIDLTIIVTLLYFIFKICVRASGDGMDCVVGGEIIVVLQSLTDLEWRWWGQIGLCFVLVG